MSTNHTRRRLARLYAESSLCRQCGTPTRLPGDCLGPGGRGRQPADMATIEHMFSRIGGKERPRWGILTLLCFRCNQANARKEQKALQS